MIGRTTAPRRILHSRTGRRRPTKKPCRILPRQRAKLEGYPTANGKPFELPRGFYSRARDLMVNGFDLIEELSEVTLKPEDIAQSQGDPARVETVAYFGSPCAFCEEAARKLYPDATLRPIDTWGGSIEDMLRGNSDRAVVPIENFVTKRTRILYDLICKYDLHIVDEYFLNVRHALLVKPGTKMDDVRIIISHIQGLFQCEVFVVTHFPSVRLERLNDTAAAARMVADYPGTEMAAIASGTCAETYGLEILQDGIQDRPDNVTRFVVLGRQPTLPDPSAPSKTSILFALPEDKSSGTLGRALEIFATHGVNLLWLDSRELHSSTFEVGVQPWNYLFYVNLEGSIKDARVEAALKELIDICPFFRMIGSYRMHARYLEDAIAT